MPSMFASVIQGFIQPGYLTRSMFMCYNLVVSSCIPVLSSHRVRRHSSHLIRAISTKNLQLTRPISLLCSSLPLEQMPHHSQFHKFDYILSRPIYTIPPPLGFGFTVKIHLQLNSFFSPAMWLAPMVVFIQCF